MPPFVGVLMLLAAALLSACGGGSAPQATAADKLSRKTALAADTAASAATGHAADVLFDWAERQHAALFPPGASTQLVEHESRRFAVRQYLGTANHLGLVNGGTIYGLGPFTGGVLTSLGSFESYLCQASPAECAPSPERMLRVRVDAGSRQCEPGSGSSRLEARRRLTSAGVTVFGSNCGFVGGGMITLCGAGDGRYWLFEIDETQAAQAAALGFVPIDGLHDTGKPSELACNY